MSRDPGGADCRTASDGGSTPGLESAFRLVGTGATLRLVATGVTSLPAALMLAALTSLIGAIAWTGIVSDAPGFFPYAVIVTSWPALASTGEIRSLLRVTTLTFVVTVVSALVLIPTFLAIRPPAAAA